jgi:uncharacterized protein YbjT (DUF2867 family)
MRRETEGHRQGEFPREASSAVVLGATGAIGSELVRQCLLDGRFSTVTAVTRRAVDGADARLRVHVHRDFLDFAPLVDELAAARACFCALGVSSVSVRDPEQYRRVTLEIPLRFARALAAASPAARLHFVSSRETDPRSRRRHVRVKGETEAALREVLGDRLVAYRPGYVHPVTPRAVRAWQDYVLGPFVFLRPLLPGLVTDTVELAHAMIHGAFDPKTEATVDNRGIAARALAYARHERARGARAPAQTKPGEHRS